jgi:hypothetical protein
MKTFKDFLVEKEQSSISKDSLARSAGTDAGNRSMRKAGRKEWNEEDYEVAAKEYNRIINESLVNESGSQVKTFHDLITAIKGLSYEEIEKIDNDIMKSGTGIGLYSLLNIIQKIKN